MDMYVLDHCQKVGQRYNKEVTKSMEIFSRIHKVAQELIKRNRLQRLDDLKKNIVTEELVDKVHENTNPSPQTS